LDINGNVSESSEKIIKIIKGNPKITTEEISSLLKLTTRAIEKNISKLKDEEIIERIGADKGGYWKIKK
jgi:ATP-dependent DNA helicase RecG